ncbi:anhydro-N-acetylmuramic acid kinase [Leadbetterella byssophila]|uniref:anhydro-N-acetylmuramic acid kinase n=1 Tax=Leadbetterella byssophila TaxID=316068 RepID=UPI0039A09266
MNKNIQKLYQISAKEERRIIGLMSGTSLDGLDIALCKYKGSGLKTEVTVERFTTVNYNEAFKAEIRKIFAKSTIDFLQLCVLHPYIAQKHAEMILSALKSWGITPEEVDVIASHGQTVYHAPKIQHQIDLYPNSTLQIGDGDHLAVATGIITLSDFRQKHCAAGGEGAPLAVYGDYLIFSQKGEDRILLNMGGIANFTYLPADLDADRVFATDTGTGNTLLDAYMQKHFGRAFDQDAQEASKGAVDIELLKALKNHSFFAAPVPKTTGPEVFNLAYLEAAQLRSNTITLSHSDVLATLCAFTADTIIACLSQSGIQPEKVFMSGGGMHNPLVVQKLKEGLPHTQFLRTDDLGIHGDAKEAVLFATLANEALAGGEISFGTKVPSVSMGKISFPH